MVVSFTNGYLEDFDEVARSYAANKARQYDRDLWLWDIYARHFHLKESPQYNRYKVDVWTDEIKYGTVQKNVTRLAAVYSEWFHNALSVPIRSEFKRTVQKQSSYQWSVTEGVTMSTEIKASVGIPDVFGVSAQISSSINLQTSTEQTKQETETTEITRSFDVPAKRSVKVDYIITEIDVQIPWEADIIISGWIAMWFEPHYNGHWLWFHSVDHMANSKFRVTSGRRLKYRAKGIFRGLKAVDSVFKAYEYELQNLYSYNHLPKPISVRTYV